MAHRLVGHDDATLGEQFLDITRAEREAAVQPDGVADDRGREAMALVVRSGSLLFHAPEYRTSGRLITLTMPHNEVGVHAPSSVKTRVQAPRFPLGGP